MTRTAAAYAGEHRAGLAYALAAYSFWGVAPVYFVWVAFAEPFEILAQRVVWSVPLLAVVITLGRLWPAARALRLREVGWLALGAMLLSVNWLTFIVAIADSNIVETSLGYFINPLVSIALGALVLRERLTTWQWAAVACATLGVLVEIVLLGRLPWYALILAFTFGFYGLVRKRIAVPASVALGVEAAIVSPLALGFLLWSYGLWSYDGSAADVARSVPDLAKLALGGVVTVVPLIWFGAAAARLPLSLLGFVQYLAPTLSLLLAIGVYGETVEAGRWIALALIWTGIAIFCVENLLRYRARLSTT